MSVLAVLLTLAAPAIAPAGPVSFGSPGLPPSQIDEAGRLVEDWGSLGVKLTGPGVTDGPIALEAIKLDGLIPAARATSLRGAVRLVATAYRAPVFPAGLDVLTLRVEEARGQPANVTVALAAPAKAKLGLRTVKLGARTVITLSDEVLSDREARDWGSCDESAAMPGWAKPAVKCDPAFRNIRAGMGGTPIQYRFKVPPRSAATVALGFCESHWDRAGQRPLSCRVEGAERQEIDPVAKWGRHKPGVLVFKARDENGDGRLEVAVRPAAGAKDRNPILNAIWLFPARVAPDPEKLIAGALSAKALRYVQVGGPNDQSIYPAGKLEYQLRLAPGASKELVFFVACQGGTSPIPDQNSWTPETLRRAASDVWRDWRP